MCFPADSSLALLVHSYMFIAHVAVLFFVVPSVSAQFVMRDISTPTAHEIRKPPAGAQHGHKEPELRMVPNRLNGFCIP